MTTVEDIINRLDAFIEHENVEPSAEDLYLTTVVMTLRAVQAGAEYYNERELMSQAEARIPGVQHLYTIYGN